MDKEQREIVRNVCCDVLEQLAFMFGDELEDDAIERETDTFLRASMEFQGPQQGTVSIIVPASMSGLLACNILGLDEDETLEEGSGADALKELLNTITGRLMTSVFDEDAVFDLTVPVIEALDGEVWDALIENGDFIAVDIEDTPVLITMQREPKAVKVCP